jgi:outer membrane protein TolC
MTSFRHANSAALIALIWVLTAVSGCAGSGERFARQRWELARDPADPVPVVPSGAHFDTGGAPIPDPAAATSAADLVRYAEAHNAGLRAAHASWGANLERVPQARSLPNPMATYGYFVLPMETRDGPQVHRFGLSQTFPLFGKRGLRGEMAVQEANAGGSRYEAARRDLRYRVTRTWNDYYYLGRSIAVTRENLELLTRLESVALSSYTAGRAPHSTVIQIQIEHGRLENELLSLEARQAPLVASLNAELNRAPDAPIPWPRELPATGADATEDRLREALLTRNPDLEALAFSVSRAEAGARLAARSPIPDLTLGAEYMVMGRRDDPASPGSGDDALMIMAGVSLPIWAGRYRAEKHEWQARRDAAVDERTQRERMLLAELDRALFAVHDADRRVDLYETTLLPKARQSMEVTEKSFTSDTAGFAELIEAQRTMLEFELALEAARADRATRAAELERLVGTDVPVAIGMTPAPDEEERP